MLQKIVFNSFLLLLVLPAGAQVKHPDYAVSINYAPSPGILSINNRLFRFRNDTLWAMNRVWRKHSRDSLWKDEDRYDTLFFRLPKHDKKRIARMIESIDSVKSRFNFCIMDGLRFYFSCRVDTVHYNAWIGNAYDKKIFFFIDLINKYVPPEYKIYYNRKRLVRDERICLRDFFKITSPKTVK